MADADLYTNNLHPGGCDKIVFVEPTGMEDYYVVTLTGAKAKDILLSVFMKKAYSVSFVASLTADTVGDNTPPDVIADGSVSCDISGKFLNYAAFFAHIDDTYGNSGLTLRASNDIPRKRVCNGHYSRTIDVDASTDVTSYSTYGGSHIIPGVGFYGRAGNTYGIPHPPVSIDRTTNVEHPAATVLGSAVEVVDIEEAIEAGLSIAFVKIWVVGDGSIKVYFSASAFISPGDYGISDWYAELGKTDLTSPSPSSSGGWVKGHAVTFTVMGQTVDAFINVKPDFDVVFPPNWYDEGVRFNAFSFVYDLTITEMW